VKRTLYLRDDLAAAWSGRDPFEVVRTLEGEVFRRAHGRKTLRFVAAGHTYFAKVHTGVGVGEVLKNWFALRAPVVDARPEYRASLHLARHGVRVPTPAAFGVAGTNPARRFSFVVCDALEDHVSLAVLSESWRAHPPSPALKRALIEATATLARRMHQAGVFHRDFYLYHVLADRAALARGEADLALIDLHRARIHAVLPRADRVRDLGALAFWCLERPLTQRDWLRFVRCYEGRPLREALSANAGLWRDVERRARELHRKARRKGLLGDAAMAGSGTNADV
jgi:heptose I phosphotransferase